MGHNINESKEKLSRKERRNAAIIKSSNNAKLEAKRIESECKKIESEFKKNEKERVHRANLIEAAHDLEGIANGDLFYKKDMELLSQLKLKKKDLDEIQTSYMDSIEHIPVQEHSKLGINDASIQFGAIEAFISVIFSGYKMIEIVNLAKNGPDQQQKLTEQKKLKEQEKSKEQKHKKRFIFSIGR